MEDQEQTEANEYHHKLGRLNKHDQFGVIPRMQGWFNMEKSVNVMNYINRMKGKNMVISTDTEKAFDKILYSFR